ncbi:MAG: response regulator [Bacteroidales bacterium]|nr:response regulator [Bacteroidales bacterium]
MRKLRALLADDEQDALNLLEILLVKTGKIEVVEKISDPLKVECNIAKHKPDVVFLDMNMPQIGGLKILENIREYEKTLPVIFVTGHDDYAFKAIKHNTFDYILKPINKKELEKTVERLYSLKKDVEIPKTKKIKLPIKEGFIHINHCDILYLKADGNYTHIFLTSNKEYLSPYNMGRVAKQLNGHNYERINRNLIVNSEYLYKINRSEKICTLKINNLEVELKVSDTFLQRMKEVLI